MHSREDQYVHELSPQAVLSLLKSGAWSVSDQTITSAETNDNALPEPDAEWQAMGENTAGVNAFSDVCFGQNVTRVLDVGGGQFDHNAHYLKREKNIELFVWDPYNRSAAHNEKVKLAVTQKHVDAVTSMSVLNVIPEVRARLAHIVTLKSALALNGKAYFKIWPGEGWLKGSYLPSASKTAYQANAYAQRFLNEVEMVFGLGNVCLDERIPNLMVAKKATEADTHLNDILRIQKRSAKMALILAEMRGRFVAHISVAGNAFRFFRSSTSWVKKCEHAMVAEHRHRSPELQREYDKRYGLVCT